MPAAAAPLTSSCTFVAPWQSRERADELREPGEQAVGVGAGAKRAVEINRRDPFATLTLRTGCLPGM